MFIAYSYAFIWLSFTSKPPDGAGGVLYGYNNYNEKENGKKNSESCLPGYRRDMQEYYSKTEQELGLKLITKSNHDITK